MTRLRTAWKGPPAVRFVGVTVRLRGRGHVTTALYSLKAGEDVRNGGLVAPLGPQWTRPQLRAAVGPKLSTAVRAAFERSLDGKGGYANGARGGR